jgi:hypothetical protein
VLVKPSNPRSTFTSRREFCATVSEQLGPLLLILSKLRLRLLFTDFLREKTQMSSCVSSCGIYGSHTLALGDFFFSENFIFDPVVVSNHGVATEATVDATVCREIFFWQAETKCLSWILVDALHPRAPPGYGYSDNETLLWWCNKVVTSEQQQCAGWTSCCVTCLMLYLILVVNVEDRAGSSVLERRSCYGAHGNKYGSVDWICGLTEFVGWFSRNIVRNAHGMSRMLLLHYCWLSHNCSYGALA